MNRNITLEDLGYKKETRTISEVDTWIHPNVVGGYIEIDWQTLDVHNNLQTLKYKEIVSIKNEIEKHLKVEECTNE